MPFAQLTISILPENATVDFPIILLKNVTCEHIFYIQNHAQHTLSCETETECDFVVKLLTTARFTYLL